MIAPTCPAPAAADAEAMLHVRCADGNTVDVGLNDVSNSLLWDAVPWRTWRWYDGQRHYPGWYWSATEGDLVPYESRLELSRATIADFDVTVRHIVAQPFLLTAVVDGVQRRHVPDYLLFRATGVTVVAVKPARKLTDPRVAYALRWVREVVEDAGWQFEVFTEPPQTYIANVRFLAGYRRSEAIHPDALARMRSFPLDGVSFGAAVHDSQIPPPRARAALLHMLWRQELVVDMRTPVSAATILFEVKR